MGYNAARRHRGLQYQRPEPECWQFTVETTDINQTFAVNIDTGTDVDITIDWDDGCPPVNYTTTGVKSCTYPAAGTYYPKITGSITGGNIQLGSSADDRPRLKATGVIGGVVGLANFTTTFYGCTGLTSLPTDLFRYNTAVSAEGFYGTFVGCTGLTSLPTDLFRYNTLVSTEGFYLAFAGCTGLTSLPEDLFRYNTLVSTEGFSQTFYGCTGLTSLPVDLFRYNTLVSTQGFYRTFRGCNKLTLNPWIFYASGEESTRFASPVPAQNFTECFQLTGAFGGSQGTAPALWDCTFNGAPTTTNCFTGHSAASVDNYGDIPTAWGGA